MARIVLLNALPVAPLASDNSRVQLTLVRLTPTEFSHDIRYFIERGYSIANYIRHVPTLNAVNQLLKTSLEPSTGFWSPEPDDQIYIVVPKRLEQRGQEQEVSADNLLYVKVLMW